MAGEPRLPGAGAPAKAAFFAADAGGPQEARRVRAFLLGQGVRPHEGSAPEGRFVYVVKAPAEEIPRPRS